MGMGLALLRPDLQLCLEAEERPQGGRRCPTCVGRLGNGSAEQQL